MTTETFTALSHPLTITAAIVAIILIGVVQSAYQRMADVIADSWNLEEPEAKNLRSVVFFGFLAFVVVVMVVGALMFNSIWVKLPLQ